MIVLLASDWSMSIFLVSDWSTNGWRVSSWLFDILDIPPAATPGVERVENGWSCLLSEVNI